MPLPYLEADVPIHRTDQPGLSGVHVFTDRADSCSAAVRIAHEIYDVARATAVAKPEIPHDGRTVGWTARRSSSPGAARRWCQ
ncbi:hypothetical protein EAO76_12200 [Streptomyces sp. sk2.1]|nr:hypothetical protein EAO76_12200 [Streptomyces sp. sk2.1]